jgi:hypothetical protein
MTTYMIWVIVSMNINKQQPNISWYEICMSINVHKKILSKPRRKKK